MLFTGLFLISSFFGVDAKFTRSHKLSEYTFSDYLNESGKHYDGAELSRRKEIFEERIKAIRQHNANPNATYKMGVNMFTDMTKFVLYLVIDLAHFSLARNLDIQKVVTNTHCPWPSLCCLVPFHL